ncbi:hypothetical protein OG407_14065 [Streptomyces sp. NBC_01515]|uniref:hypothetical protein n=1 Tax=Streptomyces sp. NBC_01515 TaxID=2903890 RepID=UPI0038705D70
MSGIHVATDKSGGLTLEFAPNQWKHNSGLRISYSSVKHFSIDYEHSIDWMLVDTVLLDTSITVRCQDLEAVWGDKA